MSNIPIKEVLNKHINELMSFQGVLSVGISRYRGKSCFLVLTESKIQLKQKIPTHIEGYKIRIKQVGEIKAIPGQN